MKRMVVAMLAAMLVLASMTSADARRDASEMEMYTASVSADQLGELARAGFDVTAVRHGTRANEVDIVLTSEERDSLRARGIRTEPKRNAHGKTHRQLAAEQAASGYSVWRSWDEPGGIRDELYELARSNPQLVKLVVLGTTYEGREIVALKVTQAANETPDGTRPAVLYASNQHAREWISVEVNRRLLHYYVDGWRAKDKEIKNLLKQTELWFLISANPDGYQYSFDHERLWRKNLRDNDGDGTITNADGVDPNRNFDAHFGYDEEGSSSMGASQTYRGPSAASEPETQAMESLLALAKPRFMSNFHSYGDLILFPQGWQVGTPDADNPIYVALGGTDANPAIPGFDPGVSSDELYVTNGETTDYADVHAGTIAFTPELGEGIPGSGFVFPDDEALVQQEFEDTLQFSLGLARSAVTPVDPVSPVGITLEPFFLDQAELDDESTPLAMFDYTFDVSYGDPQEVRVLARRDLGPVTARYSINGGPALAAPTIEWTEGERYGVGKATYYRVMRGFVTGTAPGDSVRVWFEGGGETSPSFTYDALEESDARVLILAAEDYSGASPAYGGPGPHYLEYYIDALEANGLDSDVYDVDARGRIAPDALGVLSHYDAVVWYTGDDVITREAGWGPGNASRLAMEELLAVREFVNEGGRVLFTGKYAGHQYSGAHGTQMFDPFENEQCVIPVRARCRPLAGSGDGLGDVLQYWFGAGIVNDDAGTDEDTGEIFDVLGAGSPFGGTSWGFNGGDSAQNQDHSASFITTSGLLPVEDYPQFESWVAARYDRPGGAFEPHTGAHYVYSNIADVSYKRLTRTIDVPESGGELSFWTSYDTESHWDHMAVEARTAGGDDWTTLPDANGHTSQDPGDSCTSGWRELHPHLDHYQTLNGDGTCSPTGTTGSWHAASGNSGGWQQWRVDLSAWAGEQVEVSIAYISDWSVQNLGVFVDDVTVPGDSTSFEADAGGWTVPGAPAGSAANANDFTRISEGGFPEGAVVATPDTLYFGFGFEGISDAGTRADIMGRAMEHLLD